MTAVEQAPGRTAAVLPRVSVVVPCYNYARYLREAVGSALSQRGVEVDVVVVDDASTDDSAAVAADLAEADARVRVVRHAVNRGHLETANEALSLAVGEFVVKLDADDLLTPGSLARSAALLRAHPEVAFCYGWAEEFQGEAPAVPDGATRRWQVWRGDAWTERVLRRGHNVIRQPEVMIRRAAVVAAGGYDRRLPWAEDFHLWLRLAAHGDVGRVAGPAQGLYRVHEGSLMRAADDLELTDLRWRVAAVDLYLADHGSPRRRAIGRAALAREARALAARVAERPEADAVVAELLALAEDLDARSGARPERSLSASPTRLGRAYRDLAGRVRWRRWRRYGL